MDILRRILSEKRLAVSLVAVMAVIDVGLYVVGVYPSSRGVAEARSRATAAETAHRVAQQRLTRARRALDGRTGADDELRRFYLEWLPRDLADARGITFTRLADLAAGYNLLLERRSAAPNRNEESQLVRLRMTMLLKGSYSNMRRFIAQLESTPEFIVIEEIVLNEGDETERGEVLNLGLATYYWVGDGVVNSDSGRD